MVGLSEYLPLHSVYRISSMSMIAVHGFVLPRHHESPFTKKSCLGLPVVHEVSTVLTMKSIDMYSVPDSSLVVCFSKRSVLLIQIGKQNVKIIDI